MHISRKLLCAVLAVSVLGGCAAPRGTELSKRLIVEAIGIDKTDEGLLLTLQALDAHAAGRGSDPNEQGGTTKIYQFTGGTVGQALAQAEGATGLAPLYSQARVLVLGRALAQQDLGPYLDLFGREYTARSDILLAVAEDTAREVVSAEFGGDRPGGAVWEDVLTQGEENGECICIKLYAFMNLLLSPTDRAYCPVVGVRDEETGDGQRPVHCGTAFFEDDRLRFTADAETTLGLLFLTDRLRRTTLTVQGERDLYTLRVIRSKTKIKTARGADGGFAFTVRLDTVCDVTEIPGAGFAREGDEVSADAETAGTAYLRDLISRSLDDLFFGRGADVCRFARRASLLFPKAARDAAGQMREQTEVTVSVGLTVRRTGKEA